MQYAVIHLEHFFPHILRRIFFVYGPLRKAEAMPRIRVDLSPVGNPVFVESGRQIGNHVIRDKGVYLGEPQIQLAPNSVGDEMGRIRLIRHDLHAVKRGARSVMIRIGACRRDDKPPAHAVADATFAPALTLGFLSRNSRMYLVSSITEAFVRVFLAV